MSGDETGSHVFAVRHGETEWSLNGRHTGVTDLPLTDRGRALATELKPALEREIFALVLVSPLDRARETCVLAGLGERAVIDPDLMEWNYGQYEGLTTEQIRRKDPDWNVFRDGCPGGETPEQVGKRADRIIARTRGCRGNVALFSHGHFLRVIGARWIEQQPQDGQHFLLDTGTICVLGYYRDVPAIKIWNEPPQAMTDRESPASGTQAMWPQ